MAKKNSLTRILLFCLCFSGIFLFASRTMAAQSAVSAQKQSPDLTVNADTMAKVRDDAGNNVVKDRKVEILGKALRVPLGADFKAFLTLEPPHGIEAVREELESKTTYRAVFGINIPL